MKSIQEYLIGLEFEQNGETFVRDDVVITAAELSKYTVDGFRRKAIEKGWITPTEKVKNGVHIQ